MKSLVVTTRGVQKNQVRPNRTATDPGRTNCTLELGWKKKRPRFVAGLVQLDPFRQKKVVNYIAHSHHPTILLFCNFNCQVSRMTTRVPTSQFIPISRWRVSWSKLTSRETFLSLGSRRDCPLLKSISTFEIWGGLPIAQTMLPKTWRRRLAKDCSHWMRYFSAD